MNKSALTEFERWFLTGYLHHTQEMYVGPEGAADDLLGYWARVAGFPRPDFAWEMGQGWDEADREIAEEEEFEGSD